MTGKPNIKIRNWIENLESKIIDPEFLADTSILLNPSEAYDPETGYEKVKELLLSKM